MQQLFKLFFLIALSFVTSLAFAQKKPPAVKIYATEVQQEEVIETLEALGNLLAREEVVLNATVTEKVSKIYFEDGEQVKQGQLLLELDSSELEANLVELKVATENAKVQYERYLPMHKRGNVSAAVLDDSKREWDLSKAKEKTLEARLAKHKITAPFSGVLGLRQVSEGTLLTQTTPIVSLQDLSELRLDFNLPSRYLSHLNLGDKVVAKTDAYAEDFIAEVTAISPAIDSITRAVQIRARLANPENKLLAGMLMKVSLQLPGRGGLFVPETAIVPIADKSFVYLLEPAENNSFKAIQKEVSLGARKLSKVEITQGVAAGQKLVSEGAMKVRPNQLVQIIDRKVR